MSQELAHSYGFFLFVKYWYSHAVCIGEREMQEEGEVKTNMFLCKLSQAAA